MDVVPESQAGVLHAGAQLRLQRGARRLHPEGGGLEGHGHLRGLHLSVVCVVGFFYYKYRTSDDWKSGKSKPLPSWFSLCRGNVGLSAVCAYNMTAVEDVFSRGKYMQKATVEQSHTKWVRYNGVTPSPRPGAVSGRRGKA